MRKTVAVLLMGVLSGCGGSSSVTPPLDDFELDPNDRTEVEQAAKNGDGAEGTYTLSDDTLEIILTASTFSCGIETGTLVAQVLELTATTMHWTFDDGGDVTWTRLDKGTEGIVGVWKTTDPTLYLTLTADGGVTIVGEGAMCGDDRPKNDQNCVEMNLSATSIAIDGDLGDWDAVAQDGRIDDDSGDYSGNDAGADVKGMRVAYQDSSLLIFMELYQAPSENFQARQQPNGGSYRLQVGGDQGLNVYESIAYNPEATEWNTLGQDTRVTAAVGATGIELALNITDWTGASLDIIRVEALDCSSVPCQTLDEIDICGYVDVP